MIIKESVANKTIGWPSRNGPSSEIQGEYKIEYKINSILSLNMVLLSCHRITGHSISE